MASKSALRGLAALGAALVLLGGCAGTPPRSSAAPSAAAEPYEIVRRKDAYPFVDKLVAIRLVNRYGDLRVRTTDDNSVGVSSIIQRIGTTPRDPEFAVQQTSDRFELVVRYAGDAAVGPVDFRRGRVDLVVFVPRGAALDLETGEGALDAKRSRGAVRARTDGGELSVSTYGRLDLHTRSGMIFAKQLAPGWSGDSTVISDSGAIQIGVPTRGDYRLDAEAGGGVSITEDWKPGQIEPPVGRPQHYALAHGSTGPLLQVRTAASIEVSPVILLPEG